MNTEGYVTAEQAAEALGIQVRSVYYSVQRVAGFPQPTRIGRTLLFAEDDLRRWREAHPARNRSGTRSEGQDPLSGSSKG